MVKLKKNKLLDCVTFFDNNFMFQIRYNILVNYVDYFVICESLFDHKGEAKIAVYDLGGGTFDVSIIEIADKLTLIIKFNLSLSLWKSFNKITFIKSSVRKDHFPFSLG